MLFAVGLMIGIGVGYVARIYEMAGVPTDYPNSSEWKERD